ncbi:hypothetical protein [Chitinophaga terrae (ex Kim and Jung 2007)]|uniref:hypothetical protein n=1 Tax=Chitinophaga terrae (ex Kim and Jung 2007) TaxID=408074 RepID=UPI000B7E102F
MTFRALSKPYVGAHLEYNGSFVKTWESRLEADGEDENLEPGRVLETDGSATKTKTGHGVIWLTSHEFDKLPIKGEYL